MKWSIRHRTTFHYAGPVEDNFNEVLLRPANNSEQRLESFQLTVQPAKPLDHRIDFYGNWLDYFEVTEPHSMLDIQTEAVVETHPTPPLPEDLRPAPMSQIHETTQNDLNFDFLQASRFTETGPATWRMATEAIEGRSDVWQAVLAIMRFVRSRMEYESLSTQVHTPMREALAKGRGVCQDFAHVMIGLSRAAKIPARYVSGYLATQDANASHAWTEVLIPGIGWRGVDPTHNCQPDETYVKIAVGRDYNDVPPVRGTYRGTRSRKMEVDVRIIPAV